MSPAAVQAVLDAVAAAADDNLLKLCKKKMAVMVVGRDAEAVAAGKERLMAMNDGRGPLFKDEPMTLATRFTYLGVTGGELGDGKLEMGKRAAMYGTAVGAMVAAGVRTGGVPAMLVSAVLAGIGNKLT